MDLRCAPDWQIGFLGASFFIGNVLGNSMVSHYGDVYGRIKMIRAGFVLSVFGYFVLIYSVHSKALVYLVLLLQGLLSPIRLNFSFIYGSEVIMTTHATIICSFYNFFDGLTMLQAALYFKYISRDWFYLYWYFLIVGFAGMVMSFFLPESPRYLICKGEFKRAR